MKRLKIAQVGQLFEAVPPQFYGGTERVVSWLTEALVKEGHDVTLFASGDSRTAAKLVPVIPRAIRLDPEVKDWVPVYARYLELVRRQSHDFDIIHFHVDSMPFPLFTRQTTPFISTMHGRLDLKEYVETYRMFPDVPLVSISDAQRLPLTGVNWIKTIPHGLPKKLLTPVIKPSLNYLAFLGRVSPEKGIDAAIRIAKSLGIPLRIAAKIDNVDIDYFKEHIEPSFDDGLITYIGEIRDEQKSEFLGNASALLFPIAWPEPFGLTMIEAAACGTPVLALRRASVPEVIENGITGYIRDSEASLAEAFKLIEALDRRLIRERFETRFTDTRMAQDYLAVYRHIIDSTSQHLDRGIPS